MKALLIHDQFGYDEIHGMIVIFVDESGIKNPFSESRPKGFPRFRFQQLQEALNELPPTEFDREHPIFHLNKYGFVN